LLSDKPKALPVVQPEAEWINSEPDFSEPDGFENVVRPEHGGSGFLTNPGYDDAQEGFTFNPDQHFFQQEAKAIEVSQLVKVLSVNTNEKTFDQWKQSGRTKTHVFDRNKKSTALPQTRVDWVKWFATWFNNENQRRRDLGWPLSAQLHNQFVWLDSGDNEVPSDVVGGYPSCRCCLAKFTNLRTKQSVIDHFSSVMHWKTQNSTPKTAAAVVAQAPMRLQGRQRLQTLTQVQLGLFGASNPTLSFHVAGRLMDLIRAVNESLRSDFAAVESELRTLGAHSLAFPLLKEHYEAIQDTVFDRREASTTAQRLAEFLMWKRLARIRTAKSPISLYLDESTDKTINTVLILCCSYIDSNAAFRSEFLEVFDVSQSGSVVFVFCCCFVVVLFCCLLFEQRREGATTGKAIFTTITTFLNEHNLWPLVCFLFVFVFVLFLVFFVLSNA
jgi:hypothetical protein